MSTNFLELNLSRVNFMPISFPKQLFDVDNPSLSVNLDDNLSSVASKTCI